MIAYNTFAKDHQIGAWLQLQHKRGEYMTWTTEKLQQIPQEYLDFMHVLNPIVESRKGKRILEINGIPFSMIYQMLSERYDLKVNQVKQLAQNLASQGLITVDKHGFYSPTAQGEQLILAANGETQEQIVPPFPEF